MVEDGQDVDLTALICWWRTALVPAQLEDEWGCALLSVMTVDGGLCILAS